MRLLHWAREEFRKVRGGFLFFAGTFSLIVVTDHILGRSTDVLVPNFARAVLGGLVAAKVMLVVDSLSLTHRYQTRPLVYPIVWKSALYFLTSQFFVYLEAVVRGLFHGVGIVAAHHAAIAHFREPRTWAMALWVGIMILGYVAARELSRALGTGTVRKMVLNR